MDRRKYCKTCITFAFESRRKLHDLLKIQLLHSLVQSFTLQKQFSCFIEPGPSLFALKTKSVWVDTFVKPCNSGEVRPWLHNWPSAYLNHVLTDQRAWKRKLEKMKYNGQYLKKSLFHFWQWRWRQQEYLDQTGGNRKDFNMVFFNSRP